MVKQTERQMTLVVLAGQVHAYTCSAGRKTEIRREGANVNDGGGWQSKCGLCEDVTKGGRNEIIKHRKKIRQAQKLSISTKR